jgi:hypothetical protein
MFAARFRGILAFAFFTPVAAFAGADCILSRVESVETLKRVETLILARDLDLSYGAKERVFVSNDGTIKLRITRTASRLSNSDILASVYLKDEKVITAIGQATGASIAIQTASLIPDGRALTLMCHASLEAPTPAPTN